MASLTDECISALHAATTAACIEATNSGAPQELWANVMKAVYPAIQAHARRYALQCSLISRLPDELLVEIFGHLPLWDRVRAEMVCHRWRTASLAAVVELWTDIPHVRTVEACRALLARARHHPVTLACVLADLSDIRAFCTVLSSNLHRVRGLRLDMHAQKGNDRLRRAADDLSDALNRDAPILESLCIVDPDGILIDTHRSLPLLANPALRAIELDSLYLSRLEVCAGSSALRSLKVSTSERYTSLSKKDWRLLTSFRALESLALHLTWVEHMDVPAHWSPLARSLQHLYVELDGDCFEHFAELDNLSRFSTLQISFLGHPPEFRRLGSLMPFLASETVSASMHVLFETCSLMATDERGRQRVLANLKFDEHWHTLLPNARGLWLDVYPRTCRAVESAAVLAELEALVLDATGAMASSSAPAWPSLDCPRLHAVRLLSERVGPALPAGEVLGYLRCLIGSRPRLATLVLDGIALNPGPGVELDSELLAVAEHVSAVPFDTLWPESYRVWSNSWGKLSQF